MHQIQNSTLPPLSVKQHTIGLITFLSFLGSHLFDYHPWFFVAIALVLIQWKKIFAREAMVLFLLLASIYITWYFLDRNIIQNSRLLGQGALMFTAYLLGLSVYVPQGSRQLKILFYLLFAFFIAYALSILYSYYFIEQDHPLSSIGMHVCFQNEYKRLHVNDGHLISTILVYYLTPIALILPLILFYFNHLRKQGFHLLELLGLTALSLFVLYISAAMGRRTVYVLLGAIFLLLFLRKLFYYMPSVKHLKRLLFMVFVASVAWYGYHHVTHESSQNSQISGVINVSGIIIPIMKPNQTMIETMHLQEVPIIDKLTHKGLKDKRFSWWSKALGIMIDYPLGGGHTVWIVPNVMKLAHNTWIDIGKDFGIIPFTLSILWFLLHYYYLAKIMLEKQVPEAAKSIIFIIAISFTPILMIEPVFTSDKTFIAYIFFYFGFLKRYIDKLSPKFQPQ